MTVTQIVEAARNNLSALTDTLWSDTELYISLYQVMLYLAREARCIESTATASTVAGTATYTKPTTAIELWRVTYAGQKLQQIDWREYDSINPTGTTTSGTPFYYLLFDDTLTLHPIPDAVGTITYFSYDMPSAVPTSATTLEVPAIYHDVLVDGLTFKMCPKDLGHPLTAMYESRYMAGVANVRAHIKRRRRGDRMALVKTEEALLRSDFGMI